MADTDDATASGTTTTAAAATTATASSATASAATLKLGYILVTRHAFADYQVGDEITDADEISEILGGELAVYVIKRAA